MKHVKMLGIAAVAALALMAVVGAGSASAVSLCKVKTSDTCAAGETYAIGTKVSASVNKSGANLTSSLGTVICTSSSVSGESTAAGSPLVGTVSSLSFSGCTLNGSKCEVTTENTPYASKTSASATTGNGSMVAESSGAGTPQAHVDCGSAMNCIFAKKTTTLTVTGGNPATAVANQSMELVANEGFICPSSATWEATYNVTSPSPLFIVAN